MQAHRGSGADRHRATACAVRVQRAQRSRSPRAVGWREARRWLHDPVRGRDSPRSSSAAGRPSTAHPTATSPISAFVEDWDGKLPRALELPHGDYTLTDRPGSRPIRSSLLVNVCARPGREPVSAIRMRFPPGGDLRPRWRHVPVFELAPVSSVRWQRIRDDDQHGQCHDPDPAVLRACSADLRAILHELHHRADRVIGLAGADHPRSSTSTTSCRSTPRTCSGRPSGWCWRRATARRARTAGTSSTAWTGYCAHSATPASAIPGGWCRTSTRSPARHPTRRPPAVVNAYQYTVWEDFDAYAEDSGTDYTVVNRDIYYCDTHLAWNIIPRARPDSHQPVPAGRRVRQRGCDAPLRHQWRGPGGLRHAAGPRLRGRRHCSTTRTSDRQHRWPERRG